MPQERSLWKASDPQRFFLIADDAIPAAGEFEIRNLIGQRRAVDEASVASCEITETEAREWMRGQVGDLLGGVRGWLDKAVDRVTGADTDPVSALRAAADRLRHLSEKDLTQADAGALDDLADRLQDAVARLRRAAENKRSTPGV